MNTNRQHPTLKNLQSRRLPHHHRRPPLPLKKWVLKISQRITLEKLTITSLDLYQALLAM